MVKRKTLVNPLYILALIVITLMSSLALFSNKAYAAYSGKYPYKVLSKYTYEQIGQAGMDNYKAKAPWANDKITSSNTIGEAGCGWTALSIQAIRAGETKLVDGNETNPGNLVHYAKGKNYLYAGSWVFDFTKVGKVFPKSSKVELVKVKSLSGNMQNFQNVPLGSKDTKIYNAIKEGYNKGWYPIILLDKPGHFVAVKSLNSKDKTVNLLDSVFTGKKLENNGGLTGVSSQNPKKSYSYQQVKGIGFFKFKTKIQDAKGASTSDDSEDSDVKVSTESGSDYSNPTYDPFHIKGYKRDNLGDESARGKISQSTITKLNALSDSAVSKLKIVMWGLGAIIFFAVTFIYLWYLVMPYTDWEIQDKFERAFGIEDRNRKNTITMTVMLVEAYVITAIALSGAYMYPIIGFLNILARNG